MGWKSLKEIYLEEKKIPFFVKCNGFDDVIMITEAVIQGGRKDGFGWSFIDSNKNSLNPYSEEWELVDEKMYAEFTWHGPGNITWGEPAPKKGNQTVYTELIKDIESRAEFGRQKYGQDLMTGDGRNTIKDAYEEVLDLAMYFKKLLMEQKNV